MVKSKNNKKEYNTYLVSDEALLYKLASCSLLDKLCGVAPSRFTEGARVWFFDKDPCVGNVIKQYKAEKCAKYGEQQVKNNLTNDKKKGDKS